MFKDDVLFFQRLLKVDGLYTKRLDGRWGEWTERAAQAFEQQSDVIADDLGRFDFRSEENIRTLRLPAQTAARRFLDRVLSAGINARIISGTRTYAEQNRLFNQGRYGNAGKIVTKARGGQSNHNFGIAWDIGIFSDADGYITKEPPYTEAARAGMDTTLEWGGDWINFVDRPHYQLRLDIPLRIIRAKFEAGERYTTPV